VRKKRVKCGEGWLDLAEWGEEDVGLDLKVQCSLMILSMSDKKLANVCASEGDELREVDGSG
jgi:hypothetical protein